MLLAEEDSGENAFPMPSLFLMVEPELAMLRSFFPSALVVKWSQ